MRVAGEAVARQAGIENGDFAAGTAELQGAGESGKAADDDNEVIHSVGLCVVVGELGGGVCVGVVCGGVLGQFRKGASVHVGPRFLHFGVRERTFTIHV